MLPNRQRSGGAALRYWADRWQGVVLSLVVVVTTLWLGLSGQLGLYIHPRYFVFTIVMAVIGLVLVSAGFARRRLFEVEHTGRVATTLTGMGVVLLLIMGVAMVVVPPTTLTSATATQREVNSGGLGTDDDADQAAALIGTGDFEQLSVREWVSLLAQSSDPAFYADKTAQVTGFVTPDAQDPDNVFYVARFVVTCCAVDAQPIGVPVYLPGWQAEYEVDDWVQVTGRFDLSVSATASDPLAITPVEILPVDQPNDPYVY
ncbi:MAG: TIGR03943 family protein [Cryobacterium sp.]|uniref:TIGR03943 family putative permease subunit n=1 Tax=unclassified Cryobacterium TaxID=2649013 RepID=UPI0018C9884B|nr:MULTISPECIES: TIGR03943 family protein [unclassified Cryobacterium]MCY7404959.1 TIGR03943 family protein [Cryobacterium sp.]MEC5154070.1 putative membrane protein [Cryobacterium sp. CAN_C3]